MTIRSDSSGSPADAAIATSNTPSSTDGLTEFEAEGNVYLAPNTT